VFLTPDGAPFFAGTYFPKHGRYGLPGFMDILPRVAAAYREQGPAIAAQNRQLADAMQTLEPATTAQALPGRAPGVALASLKRSFDAVHGGFGAAPKFPHAAELEFCLRAFGTGRDEAALGIVRTTLARMADGGIHDQLGGGFCRYSVDAEWTIPHFEKMLYDNGPLLGLYADTARATGDARFGEVARGIVGWMVREMRAPDGAWYASLDADSEGAEGRFYVWGRDEAHSLMKPEQWAVAAPFFGLDHPPNFEGRAWHLRNAAPLADVAATLGIPLAAAHARLAAAKTALFRAREMRVHPGRDDKILTSWNALAIAGLARAARALDDARLAEHAFTSFDALTRVAWRNRRLHATRRGDEASLNGYLDDYAFVLAALLELMQTRFRARDWTLAREIADALLERFEDWQRGGFWFTSHDHERLFHRTKPGHDNATPAGNGVAACALISLGHLAGEPRYVDAAERTLRLFAPMLAEQPGGSSTLPHRARGSPGTADHGDPARRCARVARMASCAGARVPAHRAHHRRRRHARRFRRSSTRVPLRRTARSGGCAAARNACRRCAPSTSSCTPSIARDVRVRHALASRLARGDARCTIALRGAFSCRPFPVLVELP
jgi:uncharacterized protein YyaL (SSP411 family)